MRTLLAIAALGLGLAAAPASAAPDPIRIPVCDLEGHCDRACYVEFAPVGVRCGVS